MPARFASCLCGHLSITCEGEPLRVSVCHCLACQRRSGSAFSAQARWPEGQVRIEGRPSEWTRKGDEGGRIVHRFCPTCGSTLYYTVDSMPGLIAVPIGAFADPDFPSPTFSVYEERRHRWVEIVGDAIDRMD
jgi:hypothetical protein